MNTQLKQETLSLRFWENSLLGLIFVVEVISRLYELGQEPYSMGLTHLLFDIFIFVQDVELTQCRALNDNRKV